MPVERRSAIPSPESCKTLLADLFTARIAAEALMRTTDALPVKSTRYTCSECGLIAPTPIVVPNANPRAESAGRCSNRQACASRIRRTANKQREAKR